MLSSLLYTKGYNKGSRQKRERGHGWKGSECRNFYPQGVGVHHPLSIQMCSLNPVLQQLMQKLHHVAMINDN